MVVSLQASDSTFGKRESSSCDDTSTLSNDMIKYELRVLLVLCIRCNLALDPLQVA